MSGAVAEALITLALFAGRKAIEEAIEMGREVPREVLDAQDRLAEEQLALARSRGSKDDEARAS